MTGPRPEDLRGRDAAIRVNQLRSSRIVFQRNCDELVTLLDYLCAPSVAWSYSPVEQKWLWHDGMQEVVRLLHNFVAAALSLVDHTRVLYRQLYEPRAEFTDYPEEIAATFSRDPLSQFVIKLRQMSQHYRLPSIENHTKVSGVVQGLVGDVTIQLRLKTDDLRQFDGWNEPAREFLDAAGSHIDLRKLVTAYHNHIMEFHQWFEGRQREIHGVGPDLLRRLSVHGVAVGPRKEVEELAAGVTALEAVHREQRTFADLERAFAPVLSIVDMKRLLLCRHNGRVWIAVALAAAQSRFSIPPELESRIHALV